jgi:peptidoglycan/xylan/chitin deacetylase (PgdA/CDA1 family)
MQFSRQSLSNTLKDLARHFYGLGYKHNPTLLTSMRTGLSVFNYHDVTNTPSEFLVSHNLFVSPERFEDQICWIKRKFNIISPKDLISGFPLPEDAALITFDDGYQGTFENGLEILGNYSLPSIVFLNMRAIVKNRPIISAVILYLTQYSEDFVFFCNSHNVKMPFYLNLSPSLFHTYCSNSGQLPYSDILKYQGEFASHKTLVKWAKSTLVFYGNHFYDHWNALTMSKNEIEYQYLENARALGSFHNYLELFAFTNGRPITCFNDDNVQQITSLGAKKLFSTSGGVNYDYSKALLGRLSLMQDDDNECKYWFRIGRSGRA